MKIIITGYQILNGNRTHMPYRRNVVVNSFQELEDYRKRKMAKFPGHYVAVNYNIELSEEEKELIKNMSQEQVVRNLKPIHA